MVEKLNPGIQVMEAEESPQPLIIKQEGGRLLFFQQPYKLYPININCYQKDTFLIDMFNSKLSSGPKFGFGPWAHINFF